MQEFLYDTLTFVDTFVEHRTTKKQGILCVRQVSQGFGKASKTMVAVLNLIGYGAWLRADVKACKILGIEGPGGLLGCGCPTRGYLGAAASSFSW